MSIVHKAKPGEARELAELAERTFRETYEAFNTTEDMDRYCRLTYSEAIQAGEISDPARASLLGRQETTLVGFAQLRWNRTPPCVAGQSPGEIQRLYVAREWHGRGIAQNLMQACLGELAARGSDVAWLGVWERNPRALSFYKKFGFREVGEHLFTLGTDRQRDIVMARPLAQ